MYGVVSGRLTVHNGRRATVYTPYTATRKSRRHRVWQRGHFHNSQPFTSMYLPLVHPTNNAGYSEYSTVQPDYRPHRLSASTQLAAVRDAYLCQLYLRLTTSFAGNTRPQFYSDRRTLSKSFGYLILTPAFPPFAAHGHAVLRRKAQAHRHQ